MAGLGTAIIAHSETYHVFVLDRGRKSHTLEASLELLNILYDASELVFYRCCSFALNHLLFNYQ